MRQLSPLASMSATRLLDVLVDKGTSKREYAEAMRSLGKEFAPRLREILKQANKEKVCIACTVEDADNLASGLLEGLEREGIQPGNVTLACFWNERVRQFTDRDNKVLDIAPIIKTYQEPGDVADAVLVVVKSIISGACVVKTNLAALIEHSVPEKVVVVAPVMLEGAPDRLAAEFPAGVAQRFDYLWFAVDDQKADDDTVVPGIGGLVYERLGLQNKSAYVPEIVRKRRERFAAA